MSQRLPTGSERSGADPALLALDAEYGRKASSGLMAALKSVADPDYRFLPPRGMPVVGAEAAVSHLFPGPVSWVATESLTAASGDFGVTCGTGEKP